MASLAENAPDEDVFWDLLHYDADWVAVRGGGTNRGRRRTEVWFDAAAGRLELAAGRGRHRYVAQELPVGFELELKQELALVSIARRPGIVLDAARLAALVAGLQPASPAQLEQEGVEDARAARLARLRELAQGQRLPELVAGLERLPAAGRGLALANDRLIALFTLDERTVAEARAILLAAETSEKVKQWLIGALGGAGTPAAQRLLAELIEDPAQPAALRQQALESTVQLEQPTPELVESVRRIAVQQRDRELANNAVLMLGGYASALAGSDPGRAAALVALLAERLRAARTPLARVPPLEGLGNAGDPAALPLLEQATRDDDRMVRVAAVAGLRRIHSERADAILARALADDGEEVVRLAAVRALGGRRSAAALAALAGAALGDRQPAVRAAALRALHARADEPRVRTLYENVARTDPEPGVRKEARRLLGG